MRCSYFSFIWLVQNFCNFFSLLKIECHDKIFTGIKLKCCSNVNSLHLFFPVDAAKIGISTPPVAQHVVQVILSTILDQMTPSLVIADNANLLSEIHSSKLENLRDLDAEDWWNQPQLSPDKITLLR